MGKETFTRQQLYDLVWSTPMTTIAKRFNLSDNGLRKICKKVNVPVPYLGYWQKLQYGKTINKPKLPVGYTGTDIVNIGEVNAQSVKKENELSVKSRLLREVLSDKKLSFIVPQKLTSPDLLIIKVREDLTNDKQYYWLRDGLRNTRDGFLDIKISPRMIPRALRFMDALIKLLKSRGHNVIVRQDKTYAIVFDEEIVIRIQEKLRFQDIPTDYGYTNRKSFPSGIMTFRIWKHFIFQQKTWSDGKDPIETQLSQILVGLEMMAIKEKEERVESEKRWKKAKELEEIANEIKLRKQQDKANFEELLHQSKRWYESKILCEYIAEVEEDSIQRSIVTNELKEWLIWAKGKAIELNPILNNEVVNLNRTIDE